MSETDIAAMRRDYTLHGLRRSDLAAEPLAQFQKWFAEALVLPHEANAMTLATVDAAGNPSARVVLLKGCDEEGLLFFTNYQSAKGRDLAANPRVAALFFWPNLERQVRLSGRVEKASYEEAEVYFHSRPRGSQLAAFASPQSAAVKDRAELEDRVAELEQQFAGRVIPLPNFWGGYRLRPETWEFWQGRQNRLHDRFVYEKGDSAPWKIKRLAP